MSEDAITRSAKLMDCDLRIGGICNRNPESVVHCHLPRGNLAGTGERVNSICGVRGCADCHAAIDGKVHYEIAEWRMGLSLAPGEIEKIVYEYHGMKRTLLKLVKEGVVRY